MVTQETYQEKIDREEEGDEIPCHPKFGMPVDIKAITPSLPTNLDLIRFMLYQSTVHRRESGMRRNPVWTEL